MKIAFWEKGRVLGLSVRKDFQRAQRGKAFYKA
jgi:hypothetical protein